MKTTLKGFFSVKGVFTTRTLTVMAMMLALKIILAQFTIYITPQFRIVSLAYLPGAIVAILYGPVAALVFGFVGDALGFIVKPMGPYFIGYALSEMLANFIYACLLYKKPVSIVRVLISRIIITVMITFGLNYVWNYMLFGAIASKYFTSARLISNIVQLPFYVMFITFFGRLVLKVESMMSNHSRVVE